MTPAFGHRSFLKKIGSITQWWLALLASWVAVAGSGGAVELGISSQPSSSKVLWSVALTPRAASRFHGGAF
eukprot:2310162-Pyramimonas_sp.AAC.1